VVVFTPRWVYPQKKNPRYPLNGRLDGPQSPFGDIEEEEKSIFLSGMDDSSVIRSWTIHFFDGAAAATVIKDQFIY
jgi:hypothetical protein